MISRDAKALFAINSILDRIDPLTREIPGIVNGDNPECLHRMRVASRRLRSALRLQAERVGLADARALFKLVRSITRILGSARDLDVQKAWLEEFMSRCLQREKGGVNRLILRVSQERQKLQPQIVQAVSNITDNPVFKNAVEKLLSARLEAEMNGVAAEGDIWYATRVIGIQLEFVIQQSISLISRDAHQAHHRMRIEVKRLRYAMEIFGEVYSGIEEKWNEYMAMIKELQGLLGDLHDADAWVERAPLLSVAEMERTEIYFGTAKHFVSLAPGYDAIEKDRTAFRDEQFKRTFDFWNETTKAGEWRGLREIILLTYRRKVNDANLCRGDADSTPNA
ncbi:MAG: CHAD domain-containing protein [Synergistaceae bacterium]|jgi:CHAD domain-containing protein|nr:CHAD domain-containing protein [Synergistaceae bacterium]